jgi:AcrR family transcriptional regulator
MARSRAQIIAGAQEVLALVGPQATVDQIAEASNVATSTIYLHFRDRESLFAEALVTAHATWEKWAMGVAATLPRPLDQFVTMARLFVRGGSTHPQYGKMVAHSIGEIGAQLPNFTKGIGVHI